MTARDAMVFVPSLQADGPAPGSAPVKAREERQLAHLQGRRGLMTRILRRKAAARMLRKRHARGLRPSRSGAKGGSMLARGARFLASPPGLLVAAITAIGAYSLRRATGRTFENLGAELEKTLLGNAGAKARARLDAQQFLQGNREIAHLAGVSGGVTDGMRQVAEVITRQRERYHSGIQAMNRDKTLQVDNILDIIIKRIDKAFGGDMEAAERSAQMKEIKRRIHGHARQGEGKEGPR
jgi:hypothetical protein